MGRKTFTPEQIIFKLREVEILVGQEERELVPENETVC